MRPQNSVRSPGRSPMRCLPFATITLVYLRVPQVCILDGWGENEIKDEFNAISSCEVIYLL